MKGGEHSIYLPCHLDQKFLIKTFLKPFFPFFLSFLSFINSFIIDFEKKARDEIFPTGMCHHNPCTGKPVSWDQRFASFRGEFSKSCEKQCWEFRPTCGGNRCSSTSQEPVGQKGRPLSSAVKVRSQLSRVISASPPQDIPANSGI